MLLTSPPTGTLLPWAPCRPSAALLPTHSKGDAGPHDPGGQGPRCSLLFQGTVQERNILPAPCRVQDMHTRACTRTEGLTLLLFPPPPSVPG